MGFFADMDREVTRMTRSVIARQLAREDDSIQRLIDETMASGAMRQDFDIVLVWRVNAAYERSMQPRLR